MNCLGQQGIGCVTSALLPGGVFGAAIFGLVVGFLLGLFHFRSLKVVVARMAGGNWPIALQILRFGILAAVFWGLALMGAHVLIAGLVGIMLARALVLGRRGAGL